MVTRLSVEELPPLPRKPTPERPILVTPPPAPPPAPEKELVSAIAVFRAAGYALSARMLLLLAIVGAFVLAVMTMLAAQLPWVLVSYCVLVVIPIVVLEVKRRSG
jgi:hypothetical protein